MLGKGLFMFITLKDIEKTTSDLVFPIAEIVSTMSKVVFAVPFPQ